MPSSLRLLMLDIGYSLWMSWYPIHRMNTLHQRKRDVDYYRMKKGIFLEVVVNHSLNVVTSALEDVDALKDVVNTMSIVHVKGYWITVASMCSGSNAMVPGMTRFVVKLKCCCLERWWILVRFHFVYIFM